MNFYVTGGSLRYDAPSYVEREADRDLFRGLLEGEFCYVLTARQMGKSSLMVRTANRLREAGIKVAALDLTAIGGQNILPDQWYHGLLDTLGQAFDLEDKLEVFWQANLHLGPLHRLMKAIRQIILGQLIGETPEVAERHETRVEKPLAADEATGKVRFVIFVDEIDFVRSLPFPTDEFFAAIRECYNRRTLDPIFQRLTFCLLGVASPSDLIRDTRTTPFNIGRRIELNDFTKEEAAPLAKGLEVQSPKSKVQSPEAAGSGSALHFPLIAQQLLDRILYWTEGHPYLTQRLCRMTSETLRGDETALKESELAPSRFIDRACAEMFFSHRARERDDNLTFVRERLLREQTDRTGLLDLYLKIWRGKRVMDDELDPLITLLRLSGVVRVREGCLRERNRIYGRVFDAEWVRSNMPEAELRREREAYFRGVIRTIAIGVVIVLAVAALVTYAITQNRRAFKARAENAVHFLAEANALRLSGNSGQRMDSLARLKAAVPFYTNSIDLRNTAVSILALTDLAEETPGLAPRQPEILKTLSSDFNLIAEPGPENSIIVGKRKGGPTLLSLPGERGNVQRLWFSPRQTYILSESGGASPVELVLWDYHKQDRVLRLGFATPVLAVDFSQDDHYLTLSQSNGVVSLYDLSLRTEVTRLELTTSSGFARRPAVVRFDPTSKLLAVGSPDDYYVDIWRWDSQERVGQFYHAGHVNDVAWHPAGRILASACADECVYLWNLGDWKNPDRLKLKLKGHEAAVTAVAFTHRGDLIASVAKDQTLRVWSSVTGRSMVLDLGDQDWDILGFSADDLMLAATTADQKRQRIWNVLGREYLALQGPIGAFEDLKAIDFSPDGSLLAATSQKHITVWDAVSGAERASLGVTNAHSGYFLPGNDSLVVSADAGLVRYDWKQAVAFKLESPEELGAMALTGNRTTAWVIRQEEIIAISLTPELPTSQIIPVQEHFQRISVHPEGRCFAATVANSDIVRLWCKNNDSWNQATLTDCKSASFSGDGRWLGACFDHRFQFYRVGQWENPVLSIPRVRASEQIPSVAFANRDSIVAIASGRYTIQLWKLPTDPSSLPEQIVTLESPDRSPLVMLTFSPDGMRLAGATKDQMLQVWDLGRLRNSLAEIGLEGGWPRYQ